MTKEEFNRINQAVFDSTLPVMEKLKLVKEIKGIYDDLPAMKTLAKIKALKRVREVVELLGGGKVEAQNTYQPKIEALKTLSVSDFTSAIDTIAKEMKAAGVYEQYESELLELDRSRDSELRELVSSVL